MRDSFHPYAALTIAFWSLAYVLTRLALQHFSPGSLGFLRYLIASCLLLIVSVLVRMKPPRRADLPWFLAAGGAGFFLYMIAFNRGQASVPAATGSVVIATAPIMTALLACFVYHETLRGTQWVAIGVEFAGVATLMLLPGGLSVNGGLVWMFLAALALSVYNLLQRKLTRRYSALQTSTYSIFFGTLLLAVFLPASVREAAAAPAIQLVYLALLGVFSSAVAYVAWAKAISKARQTSQVSNYMFITPFLTSIFGFLLAGEIPDRATLAGGGIILAGLLIFHFGADILKPGPRPAARKG